MSLVDVVNSRCDIGHLYRGRSTLAASNHPLRCSCRLVYSCGAVPLHVIALFLYILQARGPRYTRHSSYECTTSHSPSPLFPSLPTKEATEFHFPSPPTSLWMKHHVAILVLVCLAPCVGAAARPRPLVGF